MIITGRKQGRSLSSRLVWLPSPSRRTAFANSECHAYWFRGFLFSFVIKSRWHELSACQKLFPPQERHIDLPYKHWNMRRVLFLALQLCIGSGKIAYPNLLFLTGIHIELIHFGGFSSASLQALWWHGSGTHSSGRRLRQAASVSTANISS